MACAGRKTRRTPPRARKEQDHWSKTKHAHKARNQLVFAAPSWACTVVVHDFSHADKPWALRQPVFGPWRAHTQAKIGARASLQRPGFRSRRSAQPTTIFTQGRDVYKATKACARRPFARPPAKAPRTAGQNMRGIPCTGIPRVTASSSEEALEAALSSRVVFSPRRAPGCSSKPGLTGP